MNLQVVCQAGTFTKDTEDTTQNDNQDKKQSLNDADILAPDVQETQEGGEGHGSICVSVDMRRRIDLSSQVSYP